MILVIPCASFPISIVSNMDSGLSFQLLTLLLIRLTQREKTGMVLSRSIINMKWWIKNSLTSIRMRIKYYFHGSVTVMVIGLLYTSVGWMIRKVSQAWLSTWNFSSATRSTGCTGATSCGILWA